MLPPTRDRPGIPDPTLDMEEWLVKMSCEWDFIVIFYGILYSDLIGFDSDGIYLMVMELNVPYIYIYVLLMFETYTWSYRI